MILLTRLDGKEYIINGELVESVESTPDTVITLTTGKKLVVKERVDEVVDRIIQYKQKIFSQITILERSSGNGV